MKKETEELIVRSFFDKRVQERVLYELFKPEKRNLALHRLCHSYKKMLKVKYITEIPPPNSDPEDIFELLKRNRAEKICYSLSYNKDIDGKELPLQEALKHAVGFGFPSIILCRPGELVYFEAEQEYGAPPRYLLKRPKLEL